MKKCPVCGNEFEPKNPKGKVCSGRCRIKLMRARIEAKEIEAQIKKDAEDQSAKWKNKVTVRNLNDEAKPKSTPYEPKEGSMAWYLKYPDKIK